MRGDSGFRNDLPKAQHVHRFEAWIEAPPELRYIETYTFFEAMRRGSCSCGLTFRDISEVGGKIEVIFQFTSGSRVTAAASTETREDHLGKQLGDEAEAREARRLAGCE